jgi:signal peptidase I
METEAVQERPQHPYWRFIVGRNPAWTVARILLVIFLAFALTKFVIVPIRVTGDSMMPTFNNGQIKFVNKLAYHNHKPRRGDIVAVRYVGKKVLLLKRVVALPGETYEVRRGEMYINGQKLEEPYAHGKISSKDGKGLGWTERPVSLEDNEYFVMGDNRPVSEGFIKYEHEILGKVL